MNELSERLPPVAWVGITPRCSCPGAMLAPLVWLVCPLLAFGAEKNFTINPSVISGGGGLSSGTKISIAGTVGEPGAGLVMRGAKTFAVAGGYWGVLVELKPAALAMSATVSGEPTVARMAAVVPQPEEVMHGVELESGGLAISWPAAAGEFTLESTTDVSDPVRWSAVGEAVVSSGGMNRVLVPVSDGQQFFRLRAGR